MHRDFLSVFPIALMGVILFFAGLALPSPFGPLAAFLAPSPFIWIAVRHGATAGAASAFLAAAALLQLVPTPSPALSFLSGNVLPALLYGTLLRRGLGHVPTAFLSTVAAVLLSVLFSALQFLALNLDVSVFLHYQYGDVLREVQFSLEGMTGRSGGPAPEEAAAVLTFLTRALPAVLFVTIFIQLALNALAVLHVPTPSAPLPLSRTDLSSLTLPEKLVWIFIPSLAALLFTAPPIQTAALNVTVLLVFLYLLQGMSIVVHFMNRLNMSKPVRMLFLVAALLQPYILLLPVLAGLLDFRFDFRKQAPSGS